MSGGGQLATGLLVGGVHCGDPRRVGRFLEPADSAAVTYQFAHLPGTHEAREDVEILPGVPRGRVLNVVAADERHKGLAADRRVHGVKEKPSGRHAEIGDVADAEDALQKGSQQRGEPKDVDRTGPDHEVRVTDLLEDVADVVLAVVDALEPEPLLLAAGAREAAPKLQGGQRHLLALGPGRAGPGEEAVEEVGGVAAVPAVASIDGEDFHNLSGSGLFAFLCLFLL